MIYHLINQSNFYSGNTPSVDRLSGVIYSGNYNLYNDRKDLNENYTSEAQLYNINVLATPRFSFLLKLWR